MVGCIANMTPDYWQKGVEYLCDKDPILEQIISNYEGDDLELRPNAYRTLARAVVGQQISTKAANSVWQKYENLTAASPEKTLDTDIEEMRSCGLSARKVEYIRNIAEFMDGHEQEWSDDDEEVIQELITIKGVGRWTAEMFLIFHLGRSDVFPIADLGVVKAAEKHYEVAREEILEFSQRWQPYRTIAAWYLWRSLDK